jgi:hypothetical protein
MYNNNTIERLQALERQHYQPQQHNYNNIETIEKNKRILCTMLNDLHDEQYKKIAINCIVDELKNILQMSLVAQDREFFERKLNALQGNTKQNESFVSAESLVKEE